MDPASPLLVALLRCLTSLLAALPVAPSEPVPVPAPAVGEEARWEGFLLLDDAAEPLALVGLRSSRGARGELLEREVLWRGAQLEVLHTEEHGGAEPRLVHRELRRGRSRGRTWLAEWEPEARRVRTLTWGTRGRAHRLYEDLDHPCMPLGLVEELRHGVVRAGTFHWLEPGAGRAEAVRLRILEEGACAHLAERLELGAREDLRAFELERVEGGVARRFLFGGEELLALQWADGDPWALRVSRDRWRDLEHGWRHPAPLVVEASVQHR